MMKVYFVRHGEAIDDIEDRYGGWADLDLSPKGVKGAKEVGLKLKHAGVKADLILTSPLKRAVQTAEGLSEILKAPVETFVYLKERNTYGLLCGEKKETAKKKYPELVIAYEKDGEILGYEDYDFFLKRVKALTERLLSFEYEVLICVTHGKLLGALFKDVLGIEAKKFHDNCVAEININEQGDLSLISADGIDLV